MRVLFTTQPGHGHLNPMLPYASALCDAGHEVRFATTTSFGATAPCGARRFMTLRGIATSR